MASRKRKLTPAQVAALLAQSSDSETYDSDFDDSDNDSDSNVDSDDSEQTVDYTYHQNTTDFDWSATASARPRTMFSGQPGLQVAVDNPDDPLAFFSLFFTPEILNVIVMETNRRAAQLISQMRARPRARLNNWSDTNANEIRVFISVILYQGIVQKPTVDSYWTTRSLLSTPYVRYIMTRDRFALLLHCLHFSDNSTAPSLPTAAEKSFHKLKGFFDYIVNRFSSVYVPERDVAVDESLMLWKGRLAMKQYIPLKRARFGLKTYVLCECGSGYIWKSMLQTTTAAMPLDDAADNLTSSRIVLTLMKDLFGKGYCVYMDNFYSSPALYRQLLQEQTDAVGTVRVNRRNMPADLKKPIPRGARIARYTHDMMALKWRDKRDVAVLSTYHNDEMKRIQSARAEREKPDAIWDYNEKMGAVDLADQMLTSYPCERKRHKVWYKKLFRHLLNQIVLNSYVLFKKMNVNTKMTHVDFRIKLIERLLEEFHEPTTVKCSGRPSSEPANPLRLTGRHFPSFLPPNAGKQAPTRRCRVCCSTVGRDGKKLRRETRFWCKDCDAALCPAPCFELFHTKSNY